MTVKELITLLQGLEHQDAEIIAEGCDCDNHIENGVRYDRARFTDVPAGTYTFNYDERRLH